MDICKEKNNLKIAKGNLKIAKGLLPGIIKDAKLSDEYEEMLWEKIDVRQKEINKQSQALKAQKNQLDNSNSTQSFSIPHTIKYVKYSQKGEIIINDKRKVTFRGRLAFYIYYLAKKNINDNIAQKNHLDIGWLADEDFLSFKHGWKTLKAVRSIRKRVIKHLKKTNSELIEKAYKNVHNGNEGFRISAPHVIIEDKLLK